MCMLNCSEGMQSVLWWKGIEKHENCPSCVRGQGFGWSKEVSTAPVLLRGTASTLSLWVTENKIFLVHCHCIAVCCFVALKFAMLRRCRLSFSTRAAQSESSRFAFTRSLLYVWLRWLLPQGCTALPCSFLLKLDLVVWRKKNIVRKGWIVFLLGHLGE